MLNAPLASLRLDEAHEENSSAELLLAEQLRSPDARLEESSSLDLGLSGALLRCVRWTGTSSPMSASALSAREGARLRRECGQALRMPWLVVLRSSLLVLPVASDGEHFTPGSARFDVLVYDAASGQLRASFVASAQTDERVQFTARTGGTTEMVQRRYTRYGVSTSRTTRYVAPENPRERLEAAARSSLWANAREAVARELRSAGAAVTLRSSGDLTP